MNMHNGETWVVGTEGSGWVSNNDYVTVYSNGEWNAGALQALAETGDISTLVNGLSLIYGYRGSDYSRVVYESGNMWLTAATDNRTNMSGYYIVVTNGNSFSSVSSVWDNGNAQGGRGNINNPLAPYTSWIGVIGEAADQTLKEIPLSGNPIKIIAKGGKTIGWTGEAISIGVSLRNVIVNPSFSNVSRLQASIGIATLNLIPEGGTLASFFATGIESRGGFDGFYNLMNKYETWYHDNNLKLGNIYIPNSLLNPSGTPKFSISFN
jgi:hypothetical protein